jgi:transcriptional regulator with XRE-family HTH domain
MVKLIDLIVKLRTEGVAKAKAALKGLEKNIKKLGTVGKATFAVMALGAAAFIKTMAKLRAQIQFTSKSFQQMTTNSKFLLEDLRKSTKGMVSDLELMQAANKALLLGIDEKKLPDLFRVSAVLAKASGRTITEAIDDISTGLGRQSRLILDNLGIVVRAGEAQEKYAKKLGKTVSQLTDLERTQAFANETIEQANKKAKELGTTVENLIDPTQTLSAEWKNLKQGFAESLTVLTPLVQALSDFLKRENELKRALKDARKIIGDNNKEFQELESLKKRSIISNAEFTQKMLLLAATLADGTGKMSKLSDETKNFSELTLDSVASLEEKSDAFRNIETRIKGNIELLRAKTSEEKERIILERKFAEEREKIELNEQLNIIQKQKLLKFLNAERQLEINKLLQKKNLLIEINKLEVGGQEALEFKARRSVSAAEWKQFGAGQASELAQARLRGDSRAVSNFIKRQQKVEATRNRNRGVE